MTEHYFCKYHEKTTDEGRVCAAHLAEARCFKCPYTADELYLTNGKFRIAHVDEKTAHRVGVCEDFELEVDKMDKDLASILSKKWARAAKDLVAMLEKAQILPEEKLYERITI